MQLYKENLLVKNNLGRLMAAQHYWDKGWYHRQAIFYLSTDQAVRMPDIGPLVAFLRAHHFTAAEVEYLASLGLAERFLNALQRMKPGLTLYAAKRGAFVLPTQPMFVLKSSYIEAQVSSIPILYFLQTTISFPLHYECIAEESGQGNWQPTHLNPASILNFEEMDNMQAVFKDGKLVLESNL